MAPITVGSNGEMKTSVLSCIRLIPSPWLERRLVGEDTPSRILGLVVIQPSVSRRQYAPRPESTAGTVRARSVMSSHRVHDSMYSRSIHIHS